MNLSRQNLTARVAVSFFFLIAGSFSVFAQCWSDGTYNNGLQLMNWPARLPLKAVSGKAIVDSLTYSHKAYYIDTTGTGTAKHYQLFFGSWWYEPASGAKRPVNGQAVTVKGGLRSQGAPPLMIVYEINGLKWRDSLSAPPWSGGWIHRGITDTATVYCPTDSLSRVRFPRGFMGMGMMGDGMMWPDSLYCQFEQMHPDSLPGMPRGRALMGFHLDTFTPQGTPMMQGGMMGLGSMRFERGLGLRFHPHPDSLRQ